MLRNSGGQPIRLNFPIEDSRKRGGGGVILINNPERGYTSTTPNRITQEPALITNPCPLKQ